MSQPEEINTLIAQLEEKFSASGQNLSSYLKGLLESEYLNYWDYVRVDTLLTLQSPRTSYPDEMIFIIYHQITELYFRLTLHEIEQIADHPALSKEFFIARLKRMTAYFANLTRSFEIMIEGMETEQFLKYRMALLPASGFQSAQYRKIEICTTAMDYLVDKDFRDQLSARPTIQEMFENIYWKKGATELATGKKTLTLEQFEEKYTAELIVLAAEYSNKNLWKRYQQLPEADRNDPELKELLRKFDAAVNVNWPLVHYKSAARYLERKPEDIAATGGTNWQKYLPPRMQRRIFFPELWKEEELTDWGRSFYGL